MTTPHADLPVCVDLGGRLGAEVAAFAEAEAGWQVVDGDGPLVAVLTLAGEVRPGQPTVVVRETAPSATDLRDALRAGAVDVVVWPDERGRLLEAPARLDGGLRPPGCAEYPGATPLLRVAGSRGGVGVSTVALTIAASVAWAGGRALCVGGPGLVALAGVGPWSGPGTAQVVALGGHGAAEVRSLARDVPGVPGLAVLGGGGRVAAAPSWPYDLVVEDVGVDPGATTAAVMVAAADASVGGARDAGVVLVVEHGPLDRRAVRARLGRAPDGWLPFSHRVARAGAAGRVPTSLPGSWVAAVQQGLAGAPR